MSVQTIIETMTILIEIHEELIVLSQQKTEVIKEGSIDKLQQILSKERKYVQKLEKEELNRQEKVKVWCIEQNLSQDNITITEMLDIINDQADVEQLEKMTIILTKALTKLKQSEQLNHELIVQSMQFVQLSLDIMSPTIKNLNYSKNKNTETIKRSVFDSKA